jgi:hypothetical protein
MKDDLKFESSEKTSTRRNALISTEPMGQFLSWELAVGFCFLPIAVFSKLRTCINHCDQFDSYCMKFPDAAEKE